VRSNNKYNSPLAPLSFCTPSTNRKYNELLAPPQHMTLTKNPINNAIITPMITNNHTNNHPSDFNDPELSEKKDDEDEDLFASTVPPVLYPKGVFPSQYFVPNWSVPLQLEVQGPKEQDNTPQCLINVSSKQ